MLAYSIDHDSILYSCRIHRRPFAACPLRPAARSPHRQASGYSRAPDDACWEEAEREGGIHQPGGESKSHRH